MANIGTRIFNINVKGLESLERYAAKLRHYYIDVSDSGKARLSSSAASAFLTYVRNAFLTGKYAGRVPGPKSSYAKQFSGVPGVKTGEMVGAFAKFRSRAGGDPTRRGHVVGIDASQVRQSGPLHLRLEGFTYGIKKHDQPARPIFIYAFQDFVKEEFPAILHSFDPIIQGFGGAVKYGAFERK